MWYPQQLHYKLMFVETILMGCYTWNRIYRLYRGTWTLRLIHVLLVEVLLLINATLLFLYLSALLHFCNVSKSWYDTIASYMRWYYYAFHICSIHISYWEYFIVESIFIWRILYENGLTTHICVSSCKMF